MTVKIVRGFSLICGVDEEGHAEEISNGAILIEGGKIKAMGDADHLIPATPNAEVIGGDEFIIFPGLVNAHHHVGLTPFQLGAPDMPLELWIIERMGARVVPWRLDTFYSAFELVRSGVTTVQHLHNRVAGGPDEVCAAAAQIIGAYRDLGMRVSYSYCMRDRNRIVYGDDDAFLATLPTDLATELNAAITPLKLSVEGNIDAFERLTREYAADDGVAVQLAPLNFQWCSENALERIADAATRHDASIHMHLLETPYQRAFARRETSASPLQTLERLGLLNTRMTLGHGVWTTEKDLDAIAATDTRICHNCSSNLRLKSGTAPVNDMLSRGIKVAIGIDEAGINDDRDMFAEMRQVLNTHRPPGHSAPAPSPAQVFKMASEYGALSTGFGASIGRLELGRAADMVLLRRSQVMTPYLDPTVSMLDAIMMRGKPKGVDTVLVSGEVILSGGRFTRIDETAVMTELAETLAGPRTEKEERRRIMAQRTVAYAKKFFQGWLDDEPMEPYEYRNSRV
jgi:cytosine/adenosine deaminase-related metal-dependent hydrolase